MESELYRVTWYCKYQKKIRFFIWDDFVDDVMNKRVIFSNNDNQEVLTLSSDSYAWMSTRPEHLGLNDN